MKHLRRLAMAALAAMALAGIAGIGTASATELCTENISACPKPEAAGTALEMTTTLMTLTTGVGSITCTHSVMTGKTTTAGGKGVSVEGLIETFAATGNEPNKECTLDTAGGESDPCSVTGLGLPWKAVISKSAQPSGTMTLSNSGKGEPGLTVKCAALNIICSGTAAAIVLDFDGGNPALITASKEPLELTAEGAGTCPGEVTWDGTYTLLKPTKAYLVN